MWMGSILSSIASARSLALKIGAELEEGIELIFLETSVNLFGDASANVRATITSTHLS